MTTRWSIAQLVADADTLLPDNVTQEISPADVRELLKRFMATMKPSVASLARTSSMTKALTPTPIAVAPWSLVRASDPPELIADATLGRIGHAIATLGNLGALVRLTFAIGVSGTAGAELTFTLYVDGVATDYVARVSTSGSSNVVLAALSGLVPRGPTDSVYEVRVASTNSSNYNFTNGMFRIENVPVAAY